MSYFFKIAKKQIALLIAYSIELFASHDKKECFLSESNCCEQKGLDSRATKSSLIE